MTTGTRAAHRRPSVRWVGLLAALAGMLLAVGSDAAWGQLAPDPQDPAFERIADPDQTQGDDQDDLEALRDSIELTVTRFNGVLGPGSVRPPDDPIAAGVAPTDLELRVLVENVGDVPLDALRLAVEIHPPTVTRGLLRQALDGSLNTQPLHVHTPPVADGGRLEPGDLAGVEDTFDADEVDWADGVGGVHPVRIAVTRGTEVIAETVTAAVWLQEQPEFPLLTSIVWPLDGPPWRTAGGAYPDGVDRDIRAGGRLDVLLSAAEAAGGGSVVLAPSAHLLEDLSDRSDGFQGATRQDDGSVEVRDVPAANGESQLASATLRRIRELAADQSHPPAAGTYADADLAALVEGGTDTRDVAAMAATEGRRRTQLQLGAEVDASTHVVSGPVDDQVLDLLPGDTVLLPSSAMVLPGLGTDPELGEPVRRLQAPAGRVLTGLLADPYLEESLADPGDAGGALLAAHRPIAETAMAFLTAPSTADRGLVLLPPATWNPSPQVAHELLLGLRSAPWLELTSTGRVGRDARRSTQSVEFRGSEDGPFPPTFQSSLTEALRGVEGVTAALEGTDPDPTTRAPAVLHDDLLRATSRWYRGGGEGEALVRDVQRSVDATFGDVEVTTGSVTLTSDTGQVPITLQRTRGGPIEVTVSVESGGGLVWPEDRRSEPLLLDEAASQTVSFPTRAQSTGTFPVTVRVTDPSGTYELSATTMSVHSRAISQPALYSIGALIGVLLLVGALRRRDRSAPQPGALEVVDDGDHPPDGDHAPVVRPGRSR